jgi:hypothetical protein
MSQLVPVTVFAHGDDDSEDPMQALAVAQTKALQHLADTKADKREVVRLEAQVADLENQLHFVHHNREYLTVVALQGQTNATFSSEERKKVGLALTALSQEMKIPKQMRKDDRFPKGVGTYHPYVCRQWCVERGWPLPPILKFAKDPR